jgi:hypothetical protein
LRSGDRGRQPSTCAPAIVIYIKIADGSDVFTVGLPDGGALSFVGTEGRLATQDEFVLPLSSIRLGKDNVVGVTGKCLMISKGQVPKSTGFVLQCNAKDGDNAAYVLDFNVKWREKVKG